MLQYRLGPPRLCTFVTPRSLSHAFQTRPSTPSPSFSSTHPPTHLASRSRTERERRQDVNCFHSRAKLARASARSDTRDDTRACVRAWLCTRVCASVVGRMGGRACEDVPGQRSSTLLRRTADREGTGVTAAGVGKFIISVIPERERVIGRDIIDR